MPRKIGLDLGTDYIRIVDESGKIYRAPSVIVMDKYAECIAAVGDSAKKMLGRTPDHMEAIRPIREGVVADGRACSDLLRTLFEQQLNIGGMLSRTEVVVSAPGGISAMQATNIKQAVYGANVRKVTLVDASICAAVGSGLQYRNVRGCMVLDLGGGMSSAAVISMGDVAQFGMIPVGGDALDLAIVERIRLEKGLTIGEQLAEYLKRTIGSASPLMTMGEKTVIGREEKTKKIGETKVASADILQPVSEYVKALAAMIRRILADTPPELCADIGDFGIMLTGGMSGLNGLAQAIRNLTRIRITMAHQPQDVVIKGLNALIQSGGDAKYARR